MVHPPRRRSRSCSAEDRHEGRGHAAATGPTAAPDPPVLAPPCAASLLMARIPARPRHAHRRPGPALTDFPARHLAAKGPRLLGTRVGFWLPLLSCSLGFKPLWGQISGGSFRGTFGESSGHDGSPGLRQTFTAIALFRALAFSRRQATNAPTATSMSAARIGTRTARTDITNDRSSSNVETRKFHNPPVVAVDVPLARTVAP